MVSRTPGLSALLNLRNRSSLLQGLGEKWFGFAASRRLPEWRRDTFDRQMQAPSLATTTASQKGGRVTLEDCDVVLWADTFNNAYEPEHLKAALAVMQHRGLRVALSGAAAAEPLCCGRTALSVGQIDEAKAHALKTLAALAPAIARGVPVVGLEPSCILSLRDEWLAMGLGEPAERLAKLAVLFEEWWMNHLGEQGAAQTDRADPMPLTITAKLPPVLVHGHCHQKAMGAMSPTLEALRSVGLEAELIESSCCGMAGSFGYDAAHLSVSMAMAEAKLLPAVRQAPADAWIVADGFSCRHQIADGAERQAVHVAQAICRALGVG